MKKIALTFLIAGVCSFAFAQKKEKKKKEKKSNKTEVVEETKMENEIDSVSYALGINLASNLKQNMMEDLNTDQLSEAANAIMKGDTTKMTPQEAGQVLNVYFGKLKKAYEEKLSKPGRDFLAENAKKNDVTVTESGLQFKVLKSGDGATPTLNDQFVAHYTGTLIDGTKFDSSVDRGQPLKLPVNRVIRGWTEALMRMKVGDKWMLYIPYELGYGAKGSPPSIPPYATLIFEIELLGINE